MVTSSIFSIAIVYEDLEMGQLANHLCLSVAHRLGAEGVLNPGLWNFQLLDVAEIREQATLASASADLIIVATHGYDDLPLEVLAWIEGWVDKRHRRPGALLALFDALHPQAGARHSIQSYLQYVAKRSGLDFLTPASSMVDAQPEAASGSRSAQSIGTHAMAPGDSHHALDGMRSEVSE